MKISFAFFLLAGCAGNTVGGDPGQSAELRVTKTYEQVTQLACDVGLRYDRAVIATAIAMAESSFDVYAENHNDDGSTDYGLWQINSVHDYSPSWLMNSSNNAEAMAQVSDGGSDFTPWVTYNTGAYHAYSSDAWQGFSDYSHSDYGQAHPCN